jgi:hypothetical protein
MLAAGAPAIEGVVARLSDLARAATAMVADALLVAC